MSRDIWTQCGGASNIEPLECQGYRVVEDQYVSSTYKLVDSPDEHDLLEELLEEAKPKIYDEELKDYHYLLFTPFRYPPLRHGSRFGQMFEKGIWYGSLSVETALAETAFYRFVFLEGTEAELLPLNLRFVVYSAEIKTATGVDLTSSKFNKWSEKISSPADYSHSQSLGLKMRDDGVEAFLFNSARDPEHGVNAAVFSPRAFAHKNIHGARQQTWACVIRPHVAYFHKKLGNKRQDFAFYKQQFLVDGRLPTPAC